MTHREQDSRRHGWYRCWETPHRFTSLNGVWPIGRGVCTLLILLVALAGSAGPAAASPTALTSCTTISTSGAYELTENVTNATGDECIRIEASDVIFDGNGHVIDGTTDPDADDFMNVTAGIEVANSSTALSNVTVRNVTLTEWSDGVSVGPSFAANASMEVTDGRVTSVTANQTDLGGIVLVDTTNSTVTMNDVQESGTGIAIIESASVTLTNNTASESHWAIWVNESRDIAARNTHAADSVQGFFVEASTSITLENNTAARNQNAGIRLERSTGSIEILNNTVTGSDSIPETGTNASSGITIQNPGASSESTTTFQVGNNTLTGAFTGLGGIIEIENFAETQNRTLRSVQVTNNRIEEQSSFETPTRGISLYAQGTESQGATAIIENVVISDNSIAGTSSAGVGVGGPKSELSTIRNISIVSNNISQVQSTGVFIGSWNRSSVTGIDILSNRLTRTDHDGILISSHNQANISGVAIRQNRLQEVKAGIAIGANDRSKIRQVSASKNRVIGSQFGFFTHARDASRISRITTTEGTFRNATDAGVDLSADANATLSDVLVREATISGGKDGIDAAGLSSDWVVRGTVITNSSSSGVEVDDSSGSWTIHNTSITNSSERGVSAANTGGDWNITKTRITQTDGEGVLADFARGDWVIQESVIRNTTYENVDVDPSTGNWTIRNTTLSNSNSTGVFAENASGNWRILDANITDQSGDGIVADFSEGNWSVARAQITDTDVGVSARETSGHWSIHRSKIFGNDDAGVIADGASISGNATRNYWGASDGPSGDFSGSGNAVVGNVTVRPFYTDPSLTTLDEDTLTLTATREIKDTTVPAGESTEVTVTAEVPDSVDSVGVIENFEPAFESATIISDDGATVSSVTDAADSVTASWGVRSQVTLIYEVTVPDDANQGETFTISGTIEDTDGATEGDIDGDTTIEVGEPDPVAAYANDEGIIDSTGLLEAAADFRSGEIGPNVLLEVASAFRSGDPVT